ncbi:hypothetical protein [Pantoea allii]|uniref:hypothetical protein n=1 Tax=Pantoea allii TaxID=574096 RepID=UPI0024B6839C|nr:hypothetical protein [Pantoea allii]MDJ0040056.1 hypothetical protein [Pantoea allii]
MKGDRCPHAERAQIDDPARQGTQNDMLTNAASMQFDVIGMERLPVASVTRQSAARPEDVARCFNYSGRPTGNGAQAIAPMTTL